MLLGFEVRKIGANGVRINTATCGSGPPLLLLHGYPETHLMWHKVAPALAAHFTLVCPDLRGYGESAKPEGAADHANYSKRTMAQDMVEVMADLGHREFFVAGHDRGGRVAYRMALDHPDRVKKLALLDIVSTKAVYEEGSMALASAYFHWYFLIQPRPFPETMLAGKMEFYLDRIFRNTTPASANAFDAAVVAEYVRAMSDPACIHATCEDYRAGATVDLENDRKDVATGRKIECPNLILWGARGMVGKIFQPLETWCDLIVAPAGHAIDCGHFIPEEKPEETIAALVEFFG